MSPRPERAPGPDTPGSRPAPGVRSGLSPQRLRRAPLRRLPRVIDREQVLHVARLARLALREEEIEPMARELSAVLDHIATIGELDLQGVPATSHVIAESMPARPGLRPDEPRPSWPREVVLSQAPDADDDGFLVPSPQA